MLRMLAADSDRDGAAEVMFFPGCKVIGFQPESKHLRYLYYICFRAYPLT